RIHHHRRRRMVMIGVVVSTAVMVLVRWGWSGIEDISAAPQVLADIWLGSPLVHGSHDWVGYLIGVLLLTALVAVPIWRRLDLMAGTLLLAGVIGLYHPDQVWSMMVAVLLYYLGVPALIRLNSRVGGNSVAGQRGLVLLVVTVVALISMQSLKQMSHIRVDGLRSPSDHLLALLADDAESVDAPFLAASQWPGRTMLACRRDVFPLPPASEDPVKFQHNIKSLTHIVFNHHRPELAALAHSLAVVNAEWETVALSDGGVLLKRRVPR
ncbi:MAG: hypothetical protein Q9M13_08110, partial [Mariprofundales bacterium]|nr:hypothetical protein [Mariprofundales bacterium]